MKEYLVCEYAAGYGICLTKARRFTDEEKTHCAEWYREKGFVCTSEHIDLEYICKVDLDEVIGDRLEDGSFRGCGNSVYIVTQTEWDTLIELNETKKREKELAEKMKEIEECEMIVKMCERQGKLYTREEAKQKAREYNNLYNEGECGYVPYFYTIESYEYAKAKLAELRQ